MSIFNKHSNGLIGKCFEIPHYSYRNPMSTTPEFKTVSVPGKLYGIIQLETRARLQPCEEEGHTVSKDVALTLIPYYAWAHRGTGSMMVWLPLMSKN